MKSCLSNILGINPDGTWLATEFKEGVTGWVSAEFIGLDNPDHPVPGYNP
jgi:hypothetical protein